MREALQGKEIHVERPRRGSGHAASLARLRLFCFSPGTRYSISIGSPMSSTCPSRKGFPPHGGIAMEAAPVVGQPHCLVSGSVVPLSDDGGDGGGDDGVHRPPVQMERLPQLIRLSGAARPEQPIFSSCESLLGEILPAFEATCVPGRILVCASDSGSGQERLVREAGTPSFVLPILAADDGMARGPAGQNCRAIRQSSFSHEQRCAPSFDGAKPHLKIMHVEVPKA